MLMGPYVNGGAVIIGGLLGSVVGNRIRLVIVPVANMLPGLLLVMPFSALWAKLFA